MAIKTAGRLSETKLNPTQEAWSRHRAFTPLIPAKDAGFRGYLGLGMFVADAGPDSWIDARADRLLVPDRDAWWVTIQDIPRGVWRGTDGQPVDRETHWLSFRQASSDFGLPIVGPAGPDGITADFRYMPASRRRIGNNPDILDADRPALFGMANDINLSMTSIAVTKGAWRAWKKEFCEDFGLASPGIFTGRNVSGPASTPTVEPRWNADVTPSVTVAPRLYLGFRDDISLDSLFDRAAGQGLTSDFQQYVLDEASPGNWLKITSPVSGRYLGLEASDFRGLPVLNLYFQAQDGKKVTTQVLRSSIFTKDPTDATASMLTKQPGDEVVRGGLLGYELPPAALGREYGCMSSRDRWHRALPEAVGGRHWDTFLRLVFRKNALRLVKGFRHLPLRLTGATAVSSAARGLAYWDVCQALRYFSADTDAFILPPVRHRHWNDSLTEVGDLRLDTSLDPKRIIA